MLETFNALFVHPTLNGLVAFYKLFSYLGLPGAFGFAIIALTTLIRLVLIPLYSKQTSATKKMTDLKPHQDALQKKHKDDPKALQAAQMQLYKDHGVNPMTGCLLALAQLPIFIGLYNTLLLFVHSGSKDGLIAINKVLYSPLLHIVNVDSNFFGINLALSPKEGWNIFYLAIPVITGILQYFQMQYMMPAPAPKTDETKEEKDKKKNEPDFQSTLNTQMKFMLPLMIGYFSFTFPVGISIYWNILSVFSIIQGRKPKATETTTQKSEKELPAEKK